MSLGGAELAALGAMASSYAVPAGIGLQLAGTFARNKANTTRQNAVNDARINEMNRQQAYGRRSQAALDEVMPKFTREAQEQGQQANETRLTQALTPNRQFDEAEFVGSNADAETRASLARVIADTIARGKAEAGRQARLMSFGAQSQDNGLALQRSGSEIGTASGLSRGSNAALAAELAASANKGRSMDSLASLFEGAGNLATVYGMTRPPINPMPAPRPAPFKGFS